MNIKIYIKDGREIIIETQREISDVILKDFGRVEIENNNDNNFVYKMPLTYYNAFVIYYFYIQVQKVAAISDDDLAELKNFAKKVCFPMAYYLNDSYMGINVPSIPSYTNLMLAMGAKNIKLTTWSIPYSRMYEALRFIRSFSHRILPKIQIREDLLSYATENLTDKNTLQSLFDIRLYDLISVEKGFKIKQEGFDKLKYHSAVDLIMKPPKSYVDRKETHQYRFAPFGVSFYIKGRIVAITLGFNKTYTVTINDGIDDIDVSFFGRGDYIASLYRTGSVVYIEGIKSGKNKMTGSKILSEYEVNSLPVAPMYRQSPSAKITTKVLTNCVQEMFERFDGTELIDYIDKVETSFWELLYRLHFPTSVSEYSKTLNDLAFIELFFMQLLFLHKKKTEVRSAGISKQLKTPEIMNKAINALPYKLTNGQQNAINEIIGKMNTQESEEILLSGDVGAGKTLVCQSACLYNVEAGYQAVLAAPTEILAKQLYDTFIKFIAPLSEEDRPTIAFLSSKTKAAERKEIERGLRSGDIDILVGTHGVFNVEYKNLGLIIIDEQQKFGKEQRHSLLNSRNDGKKPDILAQTATPIPRSTALAFYGDIDLIPLSEKPNNRKENITKWIKKSTDTFLGDLLSNEWQHIFQEIKDGHQVFIVTPSVEEETKSASVKRVYKILEKAFGKNIKIDYVYGGLKSESQNKIIEKFRNNETQVLIASSVIEVGVDIPNATIMLVLDAERFGASSLHQIRGRVGRSELQGYCYLVSSKTTGNAEKRLNSLVESNDGFQIALTDLKTRKEGDLFGTKQSGESNLLFCDLADHSEMIDQAKAEAEKIYNSKNKKKALNDAMTFLKVANKE